MQIDNFTSRSTTSADLETKQQKAEANSPDNKLFNEFQYFRMLQ